MKTLIVEIKLLLCHIPLDNDDLVLLGVVNPVRPISFTEVRFHSLSNSPSSLSASSWHISSASAKIT